jgi:hypothetical protein
MEASDARRWVENFERAAERDREAMVARGADPAWSIRLALSLIEAVRSMGRDRADGVREAEDDRVRRTWMLLRQRLSR